jgi:hypothetical protein
MVQLGHLFSGQHSLPIKCLRQNRHSCFWWILSSLCFAVMSQNIEQLFGACFRVQPNTGHGTFFLLGGSVVAGSLPPREPMPPPLAAGSTPFSLTPAAAPASTSTTLVFAFFFLGLAAALPDDAVFPSGATGVAGDTSVAASRRSGCALRTSLESGGGSSAPAGRERQSSASSSVSNLCLGWRPIANLEAKLLGV